MVRTIWVLLAVGALGCLGWAMRETAPEPPQRAAPPTQPLEAIPTPVAVAPATVDKPSPTKVVASRPKPKPASRPTSKPTPRPATPKPPANPTTLPSGVLRAIQAYRTLRIDPKLSSGTSNREEDDAFSTMLRKKKDALKSLEDQLVSLSTSSQPQQATEARMALSSAYEEMGVTLRESPAPSYLDAEQSAAYAETLESHVLVQIDKAIAAAESAKETAATFPADHPIHGALQQRLRVLQSQR